MSTLTGMSASRSNKKRRAPAPPGPPKVQTSKSITNLIDERRDDPINYQMSNSKSMSMSNLKNLDRHRSNASSISATGSVTSINSLGKKRRAPPPPKKQSTPLPIPEETP